MTLFKYIIKMYHDVPINTTLGVINIGVFYINLVKLKIV